MEFSKECPVCKKEMFYVSKKSLKVSIKRNCICKSCSMRKTITAFWKNPEKKVKIEKLSKWRSERFKGEGNPFFGKKHSKKTLALIQENRDKTVFSTDEFKEKMSSVTKGDKNPMYGRSLYDVWKEKYNPEDFKKKVLQWKKEQSKSLSGDKNPMYGKPAPIGSGCGWSGWYKGWYFRSLAELSYVVQVLEPRKMEWISAERKSLEIPYVDYKGRNRTYRADFLVDKTILVEIKPLRLMSSGDNILKKDAAKKFCKEKGYEYRMISVKYLSYEAIKQLWESKLITFTKKWNLKMEDLWKLDKK